MDRAIVLLIVVLATAAFSAWWRSRDGRVTGGTVLTPSRWDALPVEAADIAATIRPTTPLVLVEFTAPDCQPCVTTKALLEDAASRRPELSVAVLDVADALDLARVHRIMRAPTTVLISEQGHLLGRVSGLPRRAELESLLDASWEPAVPAAVNG